MSLVKKPFNESLTVWNIVSCGIVIVLSVFGVIEFHGNGVIMLATAQVLLAVLLFSVAEQLNWHKTSGHQIVPSNPV